MNIKIVAIGERVKFLLKMKGWSQAEFARRLGKEEAQVSRWLNGKKNITLNTIIHMEQILNNNIITVTL